MLISVTLKWWDDLWLNEGFASYMEYKGVNHAHPDWQIVCMLVDSDQKWSTFHGLPLFSLLM
jgi:Aminopeptidase N